MNSQGGQHGPNPAMLAALQQQQAQQAQQQGMNMNMNGMNTMGGLGNMQQQLQQMYKYGGAGAAGNPAANQGFNPQMMQGGMGVNPQALMNGMGAQGMSGMGMNGRGFNAQMFQQQQAAAQQAHQRTPSGSGMSMGGGQGINPAQLLASGGGMAGMGAMGMNSMGGMGGMNMGGMGINPQALMNSNAGLGSQNASASSPIAPHSQPSAAALNPAALANAASGSGGGNGMNANLMQMMMGNPNMNMKRNLAQMQIQQLNHLSPEQRQQALQHIMQQQHQQQQQQQQQLLQQQQQQQQVHGHGEGGFGGQGMGGMNNMNMMGGMQGITPAQIAQMQAMQAQGHGFERPSSSASMRGMQAQASGQGQQQPHSSPPQPRAQTPMMQQQQAQLAQQQHLQNQAQAAGMMRPPSSFPPRPQNAAPSPTPTPQRQGQGHGFPQNMQGMGMQMNMGMGGMMNPRTSASPRVGTHPMPPQQSPQQQQQQQQQQAQQGQAQQHSMQTPVPIQPRPAQSQGPTSPARPGTSQSMRAGTPSRGISRPGTASGFNQQQPQPSPGQMQEIALQSSQQQQAQGQGFVPIAPTPGPGPTSPARDTSVGAAGTPQPHMSGGTPTRMNPAQMAQMAQMRMSGGMQMGGGNMSGGMNNMMGGAGGGMMGPPILPRAGHGAGEMGMNMNGGMMGMNGMQGMGGMGMNMNGVGMNANALARQASQGTAAGLSVNTNVNAAMNVNLGMGMTGMGVGVGMGMPVVPTPTSSSSPNPALLGMDMPLPPSTPRQSSQPPAAGSPFPGAGLGLGLGMERKISGQGVLAHATPMQRLANGDHATATGAISAAASAGALPSGVTAAAASASTSGPGTASASASAPAPTATSVSSAPTVVAHLPPLPANVSLNPKVTRVSIVPLAQSETLIPALAPEDVAHVKAWMRVDGEYEGAYKKMKERMAEELKEVTRLRPWWEKNPAEAGRRPQRKEKFEVVGLKGGKEERAKKKSGRREGFKLPRTVNPEAAKRPEQLVPIRLELDVEHHKMRDTFVWNLNDPIITPEIFAQSIVDDYSLTPSYHAIITKAIQDQLSDYKAHSSTFGDDGVPQSPVEEVVVKGALESEEVSWWETWRDNVRNGVGYKAASGDGEQRSRKRRKIVKDEDPESQNIPPRSDKERPMTVDEFEEDDSKVLEELRILVKLDIIVGSVKLEDQFEWDLDSPDPSPERFAEVYAKELGLSGEFKTSIAHSIREQVQIYQKSLFLVGHPSDGTAVQDDDLRMSMLPALTTGARSMDQVSAFTPTLNYLSDSELEKNEKEREKELNRRRRKINRGRRGITLPDREPPKTYRTPAIGFPEVDAATLAAVAAAAAPTSRRAAAAAASLTIANMVASENGTVVIPQNISVPATPAAPPPPKEKKPKGLFKAPAYPASVLRPRAHVQAPTPSTAADSADVPPPSEEDPPTSVSAPETRGARVPISAKKAKELEREAKEKEFVDGQHANMIDGVWHCSNCGCPENIAIGRRKGPLGEKSQCGTCGKFWHRHRRPRPVQYNSDAEYHLNLKREEEQAKLAASRRKRAHHDAPSSKAATVEPDTPSKPKSEAWEAPPKLEPSISEQPLSEATRATSPASVVSSASEAPLAQTVKMNGASHSSQSTPATASNEHKMPSALALAESSTSPQTTSGTPAVASSPVMTIARSIPDWLKDAMKDMQTKYPDDKFEVILRKTANSQIPEWRVKCLDCPGKLYTPGPGETLTNYEVHLKNRQHRQKVNNRVNGVQQ